MAFVKKKPTDSFRAKNEVIFFIFMDRLSDFPDLDVKF